jgi:hypothetical protein
MLSDAYAVKTIRGRLAVVRRSEADVDLLGDVAAAKTALYCRVGARALPFDECEDRFVAPRD